MLWISAPVDLFGNPANCRTAPCVSHRRRRAIPGLSPERGTSAATNPPYEGSGDMTIADDVVGTVVPSQRRDEDAQPLPLGELPSLPRDGPLVYGMGRIDASGRISERAIIRMLGWSAGDRLTISVVSRVILMSADPAGLHKFPVKPFVMIPAAARAQCGLRSGDQVLLAAAPGHGTLLVHTLASLDAMLVPYHASLQKDRTPGT